MTQTIAVKIKLLPTKEQIRLLKQSSSDYSQLINTLVSEMVEAKKSTWDIEANIPSAVKIKQLKMRKECFLRR